MDFPYTVESQADFDALVKDRLDRQARKYADYDQVKARAAELERATTAHERALAAAEARATTAEAWKADRESADALAQVRDEVASATSIPAAALRGSTKEELEQHAEMLKSLLTGTYGPVVPSPGDTPDKPASSEEGQFVTALFGGE